MKRPTLAAMVLLGLAGIAPATNVAPAEPPLSWGDQNDGTFRNPILPADYSDSDAIRVGSDFYLIAPAPRPTLSRAPP